MMINYTALPKWVSSRLWQDALEQSGLLGSYFMEWDDQGYITNAMLLRSHDNKVIEKPWFPTPQFRFSFRTNDSAPELLMMLRDAVNASAGSSGPVEDFDHSYLWHYNPRDIYQLMDNWERVVTIYHSAEANANDAILNSLISDPDKKQGVIFSLDWRGPSNRQNNDLLDVMWRYGSHSRPREYPQWDHKARPSLAALFGAEVFGVQRHDANRAGLHYDLRLERKGVLKSWSIPKGMPTNKQHLAIATADHKMSWLDFEGDIPKGSYGAGNVKLDNKDTFDTISYSPKKWVFYVNGGKYKGKYTLIHWKENKWLIRRNKDQNK